MPIPEGHLPAFDPRYDASYQRGFAGKVEPAPRQKPPVAPRAETAPETSLASIPEDAGQPSIEFEDEVDLPERQQANPYYVGLWIVGVVLSVGGVLFYLSTVLANYSSNASGGSEQVARVVQLLGYVLSAPLLTVGLGTIGGLLFGKAARFRRGLERR